MSTSQKRQFNDIFTNVNSGSATITGVSVAAGVTRVADTIAVTGAALGDVVFVTTPASLLNLILSGEVTAAGVVTLKFANVSAGAITPPTGVYTAVTMPLDAKMSL